MSAETSEETKRKYGLERVCRVLGVARSTVHARRSRERAEETSPKSRTRGPAPAVTDEQLLGHIRQYLTTSVFVGEGHRKVWAALRVQSEVRVSKRRVLRLMREHNLLAPTRGPVGAAREHTGKITTSAPDEMWATDGSQVLTVDDGRVWIFVAVDHFNAECVGWHVAKEGTRFAALQPLAMALTAHRGGTACDAGRGIRVRQDHGCQYTSAVCLDQVRAWGMAPSFAFVGEPQTNGVAERFIRTLKEQAIHGRVFKNVDELREAVGRFVQNYNCLWRVEKLAFKTPLEARAAALPLAA